MIGITPRTVLLSIIGLLGVQNLLLLVFLGQPWSVVACSGGAIAALLAGLHSSLAKHRGLDRPFSGQLLLACFAVAIIVYALGGEGRFFYANTDWQIRGAVLHDMARYPWPFAYADPGGELLLRAPMGMYLLPAALAKAFGERAVDVLLLLQNALLLTGILSLGSTLFPSGRARAVVLFVFLGFSGMDCVGEWLVGHRLDIHLEQWTGLQYSALMTQAFWVPQHAMAGWFGALLYLLWQQKKVPLVAFAAASPLIALLSPLAMLGLVPFMAHAGLDTLVRRQLRPVDIVLPLLALAMALPSLLYMTAGSGKVGGDLGPPALFTYAISIILEVGLPLLALFLHGKAHRHGIITSLLVLAMLLAAPFGHVGPSADFVMRASIPALAILALLMGQMIATPAVTARQRLAVELAVVAFILGLATPVTEIIRALRFPASPALVCNYMEVVPGGAATYVAPLAGLPPLIRLHAPMVVTATAKSECWDGPWPVGETTGLFDTIPAVRGRTYWAGEPNGAAPENVTSRR